MTVRPRIGAYARRGRHRPHTKPYGSLPTRRGYYICDVGSLPTIHYYLREYDISRNISMGTPPNSCFSAKNLYNVYNMLELTHKKGTDLLLKCLFKKLS